MKHTKRLARLTSEILSMRIPVYAGNASFFLVLSAFPIVTLLLAVLPYLPVDVGNLLDLLSNFIPDGLTPLAEQLVRTLYDQTPGAVIPVSILTALWTASSGMMGILYGLNHVLGAEETRSYFARRGLCALCTVGLILAVVLTLLLNVWGRSLLDLLRARGFWTERAISYLLEHLHLYSAAILTVLFAVMYLVLPCARLKFLQVLPGAAAASCAWVAFSELFSLYVGTVVGGITLYGGFTLIVLTLLWLFFCMMILFLGQLLNRLLFLDAPGSRKEAPPCSDT